MLDNALEIIEELEAASRAASRKPIEILRYALSRTAPLLGADFGSVFLRDPDDPALLKLVCAHNWPQASARYLGEMRIRVGRGPTGRAVEEGVVVEVPDLFGNIAYHEWWKPARELGFASLISVPLRVRGEIAGAVSFYFRQPHEVDPADRRLVEAVTEALGAAVDRAGAQPEPA